MLRANGDNAVPRTNLLLYGPSGCGKTAIIREAAKIAELPFLTVMPPASPRPVIAEKMRRTL